MFCQHCGAHLPEDADYCPGCGVPLHAQEGQPAGQPPAEDRPADVYYGRSGSDKPVNGMGLAGMIIGICGIFFSWAPFFGAVLAIVGIILSGVGMAKHARYRLNGFAVAGLVLNIICLIPAVVSIATFAVAITVTVA